MALFTDIARHVVRREHLDGEGTRLGRLRKLEQETRACLQVEVTSTFLQLLEERLRKLEEMAETETSVTDPDSTRHQMEEDTGKGGHPDSSCHQGEETGKQGDGDRGSETRNGHAPCRENQKVVQRREDLNDRQSQQKGHEDQGRRRDTEERIEDKIELIVGILHMAEMVGLQMVEMETEHLEKERKKKHLGQIGNKMNENSYLQSPIIVISDQETEQKNEDENEEEWTGQQKENEGAEKNEHDIRTHAILPIQISSVSLNVKEQYEADEPEEQLREKEEEVEVRNTMEEKERYTVKVGEDVAGMHVAGQEKSEEQEEFRNSLGVRENQSDVMAGEKMMSTRNQAGIEGEDNVTEKEKETIVSAEEGNLDENENQTKLIQQTSSTSDYTVQLDDWQKQMWHYFSSFYLEVEHLMKDRQFVFTAGKMEEGTLNPHGQLQVLELAEDFASLAGGALAAFGDSLKPDQTSAQYICRLQRTGWDVLEECRKVLRSEISKCEDMIRKGGVTSSDLDI